MASDAFFPFADYVEIAYQSGIKAVVQPGDLLKIVYQLTTATKTKWSW